MKAIAIGLMAVCTAFGQSGGDSKGLKGEIKAIHMPTPARADKGVLLIVQITIGDGHKINLEIKKETKLERESAKDSRTTVAPKDLAAGQFFEATYTGAIIATEPELIENVTGVVIKNRE